MAKQKILIIDDSQTVIAWVNKVLSNAGYEVCSRNVAIGSGAAIVREKPDLVLMDIKMPALQGDEIVHDFRKSKFGKKVRLILHSSLPVNELTQKAKSCEADGFIQKTNNQQKFIRQIKHHLSASTAKTQIKSEDTHKKILVFSDNPFLSAILKMIFGEYPNFDVVKVNDDLEAAQMLETQGAFITVIVELRESGPTMFCKTVTLLLDTHTTIPLILISKDDLTENIRMRPRTFFLRANPLNRLELHHTVKQCLSLPDANP